MNFLKTINIYDVNYSCAFSPTNEEHIYIAISHDTLLLYNDIMSSYDTLIEGDSISGIIIGADAASIADIIHKCYDIREGGKMGRLHTDFGFSLTFY